MDYYCLSLASGKANKQTKPTHQVHGQMNSRGINRSVNLLIQTRFVLTTGWEQAHEQLLWNRKCSKFTAFTNYPAEARPAACVLWATPHQCETCNSRQRVCNIFLRAVVQGLDPHTDASPADRVGLWAALQLFLTALSMICLCRREGVSSLQSEKQYISMPQELLTLWPLH